MSSQPIVVVGAGLAGMSAALALAPHGPVLLADATTADSASMAAVSGLANPLMAQKANPVWRVDQALAALARLGETTGAQPSHTGLIRPATSWKQEEAFRNRAMDRPDLARWVPAREAAVAWPWLKAPFGALDVLAGGAWSIPDLLKAGLHRCSELGVSVRRGWTLTSWDESPDAARAEFQAEDGKHVVPCGRLILALGAGIHRLVGVRELDLHPIKGQLVTVSALDPPEGIQPISGSGYVVPQDGRFVIGSSYEHEFDSATPTRAVSRQLLSRAIQDLPWLEGATIESERAGVRMTVPRTRLPMIGPLPDCKRTWVFSGLGSKGLLTAPLIASLLPDWLAEPENVPAELAVRARSV